ncbi:CaiB/BaiF CoA transferase family protein [Emcibacter sp.]|uniref:CaiB/BaiF CoA transferase family protein n=1 Tax=Emcibacter sp. TaxID=1979954 RepID=UPI003A8D873B
MVLGDLKVVDFSWSVPGPLCSLYLADMGAQVVRIESSVQPEAFRSFAPLDGDSSYSHRYLNRNKDCIAVDLKSPEDAALVRKLVDEADILIEQFRPGTMDRLGFGYDQVRKSNPGLIYCSISGYGQTGEYSRRAGHDINYFSLAGAAEGQAASGQAPAPLSFAVADVAGGLHGVIGILMALRHRDQTGKGQHVDVGMTDAIWAMNAVSGPAGLNGNCEKNEAVSLLNGSSFYNYYRTSDDRYLAVGSLEEKFRRGLCEALGREDLLPLALEQTDLFHQELVGIFREKPLESWMKLFADRDVCVDPVLSIAEAGTHPHFVTRKSVVNVPHTDGDQRQFAHPVRYSALAPRYRFAGKDAGEDTEEYRKRYNRKSSTTS